MMNQEELIKRELDQAGEAPQKNADVLDLLKRRITPETQLSKMEFLFRLFGVPCFPRGELVAVAGKAKSGKTFFLSVLMAESLTTSPSPTGEGGKYTFPLERESEKQLRVMWYDTEQSEQSTQDIMVNRIMRIVEADKSIEQLYAFNTRCLNWEQRLNMFCAGVAWLEPDLVVLDGVRDLINDINDGVEAKRVTEQLMTLAQKHRCCIVCVLHQNKSDSDRSLRGWIGTELTNKVFEVYSCEKLKESLTFKVEQTHTRKYDIGRQLYYNVDPETGLPEQCDKPATQPRDEQGRFMSRAKNTADTNGKVKWESFNQTYIIHHPESQENPWEWNLRRLFTDAMEGRPYRSYGEVMGAVMRLSRIVDKYYYYARFDEAVNQQIIAKETSSGTGTQYVRLLDNNIPF